jgi:FkbM family methyltransferase
VRTIASGLGKGLRLEVLPGTPVGYWLGTHESWMQAAFRAQISPGMTVYDCGANIGYFSVMLARLVGSSGRVYAFEPSPESFRCLQRAPGLNHLEQLIPVQRGVWDRAEVLRFSRGASGDSLVSDHIQGVFGAGDGTGASRAALVEIESVSLDGFVYEKGHPAPDFIKLDVEGAESRALAGARRLLAERRPGLLVEIHGGPGRDAWGLLKDLDYRITRLGSGEEPRSADEFAVWISQYLALPAEWSTSTC